MKRLINKGLSALMAAVMLMTVIVSAPFVVNADDTEPEFVFERFDSGYDGSITVKLSRYNGSDENVDIPGKVPEDYQEVALRGKDVSIIKESAFYENQNIKSVTIPDNVNHIARDAFAGCPNLEEVTIGSNLDFLGDSAFATCTKLSKVTIYSQPSNFSFGDYVFYNSPNVTVHGYHGSQIESTMISKGIPFKGLDHSYGDPVWTWEDDYSDATASFSCSYGDDTETINATITSEVVSYPTVHNDGRIKHIASVPFGDYTYSSEQWETIPKLVHVAKKFPTADSNGNIEYWYNGRYYSDAYGEHEITEAETLIPYFTFGTHDKFFKLIKYNGNDETVTVPTEVPDNYPNEELQGKHFSIIKEGAFKGNSTLKKVVLQNNIGNVSDYVFVQISIISVKDALIILLSWKKSRYIQKTLNLFYMMMLLWEPEA